MSAGGGGQDRIIASALRYPFKIMRFLPGLLAGSACGVAIFVKLIFNKPTAS